MVDLLGGSCEYGVAQFGVLLTHLLLCIISYNINDGK